MSKHPKIEKLGDWWDAASDWLIAVAVILVGAAVSVVAGLLCLFWVLQLFGGS